MYLIVCELVMFFPLEGISNDLAIEKSVRYRREIYTYVI